MRFLLRAQMLDPALSERKVTHARHLLGVGVCVCAYTGVAVAVSHDEVEGGTGLTPVLIDRTAAVLKHLLAQVCTLLCLLLKQQVPKLQSNRQITRTVIYADTHTHAQAMIHK